MATIINRQKLAERWDTTPTTLDGWEREGVIHRLPKYPTPRYSLTEVEMVESNGMNNLVKKKERIIREQAERIEELEQRLENTRRVIG